MPVWREYTLNKRFVGRRTERSTMLYFPKESVYDGYVAWIPNKLIRENENGTYNVVLRPGLSIAIVLSRKNDRGYYEEIDKRYISGEEMIRPFLNANEM